MVAGILAGIGGVATGAYRLINAFGGGGGQQAPAQAMPGFDLTPLYASLLMGDNANLSAAGQEMGAFLGDLMRGRGLQDQIGYNQTMGQFNETMNQQRMATGLQSGVASMLASNAIGLGTEEARSKLATQMAGVENMYQMRQDQRDAKREMDKTALGTAGGIALANVNNDMALKQSTMNNATSLRQTGLEGRQASLSQGLQNQGTLLNTGMQQAGLTQRAGIEASENLRNTGLQQQGALNLAGINRGADLQGKSLDQYGALSQQGLALRAEQQMTGMKESAATDRAGIQSMTQQNIAAMGTDKDLLMQGMQGTQALQQTQAQGNIQAGLAAQATANKLAGQQGESNVRIGESQEGLRADLIKMSAGNLGDVYKGAVGNIQGTQREQELLKGTGQLQRDMLVGQTDQQRQIQEDKYEGEQSLIGGKAIADQEMLIGKTKADQSLLYGQIQADKVRGEMDQNRAVEMSREKFNQDFAMQDARFKQDMAKKRYGAGMAMAGQRAFA